MYTIILNAMIKKKKTSRVGLRSLSYYKFLREQLLRRTRWKRWRQQQPHYFAAKGGVGSRGFTLERI